MKKTLVYVCCLVTLLVTGCRPDDTDTGNGNGTDTLTFIAEDTLDVGVWVDDTVETYADRLADHQLAMNDIFFDYNSEELSGEMLDILMADAGYMMSSTDFRVLLEGHCDERGTVDYNLALGERRAQAVYDYLLNYGIPASRLETVSYGKERPFVTGTDDWAFSQNRRVHIRVLPE